MQFANRMNADPEIVEIFAHYIHNCWYAYYKREKINILYQLLKL